MLVAQQTTEAAIDSLYDPVIVTDAQGRVTKLNPAAEEIFGPETKNIGRPVQEVAHDGRIAMAENARNLVGNDEIIRHYLGG